MHTIRRTFVVDFWSRIFDGLRRISIFQLIRAVFKSTRRSYLFVDTWVISNLLLAGIATLLNPFNKTHLAGKILLIYGALRVFEIVVYQINVLLFDEYRAKKIGKPYAVRGFRRVVILLLHNYIEIIFWYAFFYMNFNLSFNNGLVALKSGFQAIGFSFNVFTTFGYASTFPVAKVGYVLVSSEAAIGVFMALVILARFVSLIPSPETLDEFEK